MTHCGSGEIFNGSFPFSRALLTIVSCVAVPFPQKMELSHSLVAVLSYHTIISVSKKLHQVVEKDVLLSVVWIRLGQ